MRPQTRRILSVATVTLAALLAPAVGLGGGAVAGKGQPVIKAEKIFDGFYYGDFDDELLLLSGPPLAADNCAGDGFPLVTKFYRQRRDGAWSERWRDRETVTLYSTPLGGPEFVEEECDAILSGGDPPEPFATGQGQVRSYISTLSSPDGPPLPGTRIVNSTFGFVTDDDGQRYRVKAKADVVLDDDLFPVGSPTEFQGLRVQPVGG